MNDLEQPLHAYLNRSMQMKEGMDKIQSLSG